MTIIQHKRGISTNWTSSNPTLAVGEIGYETNTGKFKIGDGASAWSALPYFSTSAGGSGTVTSVDLSVPTGLSVSGNPVTTSGTLAISLSAGYAIPTTAKQTEWDTAYTDRLKWDGGSTGLDSATARTSLGLVIGTNVQAYDADLAGIASATLSSAGFLKTNGSGVYSTVTDSSSNWDTAYAWGNHASAGYQAGDADLTAIAALSANGLLRKTAGTWGMDTATYLTSYTETDTLSSVTGRGATTSSAISITDSTSSTTTTTGALKVTGGVGIQENLNGGGNLTLTGNLTVNGTTTTLNSTVVTVDDPIFTLGGDTAPGSDDNKDRGIAFRWHNGVSSKIGFFGFDDSTQYLTFVPDATITSEVISGSTGTFDGSITGNAASATSATSATSADTVKTISTATNASFYPTFVDANNGTATSEALYTDAGIAYNPSTNTLTATTFSGALSGNASTASSAAIWTTARNLAGNSVDGSGNVAFSNKFIVQGTTDTGLSGAQFLGALGTGIIKNTTTTGVLSIAVAGDFPTLNQNTTGSAATLTTARNIWGQSFNGSGNVTGNLTSVGDITGSTTMAITAGTASNISLNAGSIAGATGTGGTVTISSGNGGSTSGAGGAISIDTGTSVGVGGAISIGTTNSSGITIGRAGVTTTIDGTLSATVSNATSADTAKTVSTATNASFYPVFVDANNGTATAEALYTDAGLVYNPSTNKLSTGGDISVNGGDLETTSTGTATLFNTNATTLNIGGAATALTIGASTGTTTIGNGLVLAAGTTSLAPLDFSSSTDVLSSPVAGAVEYNNANFFATPFTTSGRGLIESNYFYSNLSSISIAGTSTGGASVSGSAFAVSLPLATSMAYQIEATLYLQTSYSVNAPASQTMTFSYPTGTTILAEGIIVQNQAAVTTQTTAGSFYAMQANTNRTITAVTVSGNWHRVSMRGIIRTSTNAGSFSINFGGTNGATPATLQLTLGANSFIKLTPVGSATSDNSIGAWA